MATDDLTDYVTDDGVLDWSAYRRFASSYANIYRVHVDRPREPTRSAVLQALEIRRSVNFNTTNRNYGPVYNINHVENAFGLSPSLNLKQSYPVPSGDPGADPPNGFVLFGFAFIKSQQAAVPATLGDAAIHRVIIDTWDRLGAEEKARVEHEVDRADELHMTMVGSRRAGAMKGERTQEKHRNWTGSLSEFWMGVWDSARRVAVESMSSLWAGLVGTPRSTYFERDGGAGYFAPRRSKSASRSRSWDGDERVPRPPDIGYPASLSMSEGDPHLPPLS